jgi:hypothetical protein
VQVAAAQHQAPTEAPETRSLNGSGHREALANQQLSPLLRQLIFCGE